MGCVREVSVKGGQVGVKRKEGTKLICDQGEKRVEGRWGKIL